MSAARGWHFSKSENSTKLKKYTHIAFQRLKNLPFMMYSPACQPPVGDTKDCKVTFQPRWKLYKTEYK